MCSGFAEDDIRRNSQRRAFDGGFPQNATQRCSSIKANRYHGESVGRSIAIKRPSRREWELYINDRLRKSESAGISDRKRTVPGSLGHYRGKEREMKKGSSQPSPSKSMIHKIFSLKNMSLGESRIRTNTSRVRLKKSFRKVRRNKIWSEISVSEMLVIRPNTVDESSSRRYYINACFEAMEEG